MKKPLYASRRIQLMLIVLVTSTLACSMSSFAAPTATPVPTNTPIPPTETTTPTPTNTPTLTPTATATPNRTATAAVKATEQAAVIINDIQTQLQAMDMPTEGSLGWVQDQSATIELSSYQEAQYYPFAENLSAADYVLHSKITWISDGWMTCGFLFRSEKDFQYGRQYVFQFLRLSGLPAWSIDFDKDGYYVNSPSGTRFSDHIDQSSGGTNEIYLMAQGEKFVVYINKQSQGRYFDYSKQSMQGYFAYLAWQDSGQSSCIFEDTWVWLLK